MFDREIVDKILKAWSADQSHPHRRKAQKALPDPDDTRVLLETAFLASIRREEEKPITFSLALLCKGLVEKETPVQNQNVMPFSDSLPFSDSSISKIAPAFDSSRTFLIVSPTSESKNEYEIWGILPYRLTSDVFNEIPVGSPGDLPYPPDILCVTAVSPGSLIISRGASVIGRFFSGHFESAIPTPFYSEAMGHYLLDMIKNHKGYLEHKSRYWGYYSRTLGHLLTKASNYGHGGTIILLPRSKSEEPPFRGYIDPKYCFNKTFDLEDPIISLLKSEQDENNHDIALSTALKTLTSIPMKSNHAKRIDFLAKLSCIDGALIVTDDLHLLSFGSTLKAPKWDGNILTGPDGFGGGGAKFDASKLGTRHNSAIDFVGACPGSVAFVISKDGPVRGFIQKDKKLILCWPDCNVSMSLEEALGG